MHVLKRLSLAAIGFAFAFTLMPAAAFADEGIEPYANITNRSFYFKFNATGDTYLGDDPRAKDNSTSVYIWVKAMSVDRCKAYTDGAHATSGPWYNKTVKGYATIKRKGEFFIDNYINEHGFDYARLTGWADSQPGVVSGVWSPDSVGSYPRINGD